MASYGHCGRERGNARRRVEARAVAVAMLGWLASACLGEPLGDPPQSESSGTDDGPVQVDTSAPPVQTTLPEDPTTGEVTGIDPDGTGTTTDGGTLGEGEPCEIDGPDECASGLKCMPYSNDGGADWNAGACFPIDPNPVGLYEPCEWYGGPFSGYDNCGEHAICNDFDGDGDGVCIGRCIFLDSNWDSYYCEDPTALPGWGCQSCFCTCEHSCDPVDPTSCTPGNLCVPLTHPSFSCVPDASMGGGNEGDPCEFVNVCQPGLLCLAAQAVPGCPDGSVGCCTSFCDITLPNTCAAAAEGAQCVAWFERGTAPEGLEHVGVCILPP